MALCGCCRWFASAGKWFRSLYRKIADWLNTGYEAIGKKFKDSIIVQKIEKTFPGWELGVAFAIVAAILTFNLNLWFLVIVTIKHKPQDNGLGTLWEGNCDKVEWANKIAHGVINILSTLLIAQSNFCMQLLASPTRGDIDKAHRKRQWVDIGIPSFRNVWQGHISRSRVMLWVLLGLGSVPLHLLWNSAIIFSPIAYQYLQLTATEDFARGLPLVAADRLVKIEGASEGYGAYWPDNIRDLQRDLGKYEKLDSNRCKKEYARYFIADRSDVIVIVQSPSNGNTSAILGGNSAGWGPWPYSWLCPSDSRRKLACTGKVSQDESEWLFPMFGGPKVSYCLSKRMDKKCRLEYGLWATVLTVVANALKLACFVATYWLLKRKGGRASTSSVETKSTQPLVTAGDAIASFLEFEDKQTRGMSIVEKEDFLNGIWAHRWIGIRPMTWFEKTRCCRFRAIGLRRWLTGNLLLLAIPLFPFVFLLDKMRWLRQELGLDTAAIRELGLGNPSGLFLFGVWNGNLQTDDKILLNGQPTKWSILRDIALANVPQLALAVASYIWNGHLTVMTAARDYDEFAACTEQTKHGLRVTYPQEGTDQRAAYFFAIPFKRWVLVTLLWTLLHWFASQAVFFARVDLLSHWLEVTEFSISQVGYSILGMICFLVLAAIVFLYGLCFSITRIPNRMPLSGTCSAALSAACHPEDSDGFHYGKKVHWGVENHLINSAVPSAIPSELPRCTFTSSDATYPTVGQAYA